MLTIAHRGDHTDAPENTLEAFRRAVEAGMDGVELDVHLCASGEVVVIHDDTVNRTTNGIGKVAQMDWAALKTLHAGAMQRIPRLEEALEAVGPGRYCFIEIKAAAAALPAAQIVKHYARKGWNSAELILISFQHDALKAALAETPGLTIGASYEKLCPENIRLAANWGVKMILPHHRGCDVDIVSTSHAAGLQVIPWTVNSSRSMRRLVEAGADGIISDHCGQLATMFQKMPCNK